MSAVPLLRQFVNERLSAAAEEIFGVFEKKIVEYEAEIHHQRKLLQFFLKPQVQLNRINFQQQQVCEDQEQEQQDVCVQTKTFSVDQKHLDSVHIKEEELWSSEEGEQLGLKQETDAFMEAAAHQESDHSEDPIFNCNIEDVRSLVEEETSISVSVQSSVVPEANSEQQLLSHNSEDAENQHQEDSGSTTGEPEHNSHTNPDYNEIMSAVPFDPHTGKTSLKCHKCDKVFTIWGWWWRHVTNHPGEKFTCKTCGKDFTLDGDLKRHMRIHTVEKLFTCTVCGRDFRTNSHLKVHMKIHTDEKPYVCKICTKGFYTTSQLNKHIESQHTERPFICTTCGRPFQSYSRLRDHMKDPQGCRTNVPVAVTPTHVQYDGVYLGSQMEEFL